MFSTIPCHLQLPLCLFAQCLPTRSRWFSGSRTQPPACPWLRRAVRLGVLHSPIRYALNLSLIQGHILFYLKVILTLFLPKKLNLSTVSRLVFFHFISNRPLFQRWKRKHGREAESGTLLNILLCSCFSHTQHSLASRHLTTLLWPSVTGRSGASFPLLKMYFHSFKTLHAKNFSDSLFIFYQHSYLTESILPPNVSKNIIFPPHCSGPNHSLFYCKASWLIFSSLFQKRQFPNCHHRNFSKIKSNPGMASSQLKMAYMVRNALYIRPLVALTGPLFCPAWPLGFLHFSSGSPTVYSLEF